MQRVSKIIFVSSVIAIGACLSACQSDDEGSGGTGGIGGAASGGAGGVTSGGAGGVAGTMTGGIGGANSGGVGGMAGGGTGGSTGGAGGMTGGTGMTGGMGGMTGGVGGMGGMTGGMGGGEPDAGMEAATFTEVYDIIEMKCGGGDFGCHVMGESGDLNMNTQEEAYTNLVDVDGENCPDKRVVAGDADASLLIKALLGSACGEVDQMPKGRDPLSADDIETVRSWIEAGAMDN